MTDLQVFLITCKEGNFNFFKNKLLRYFFKTLQLDAMIKNGQLTAVFFNGYFTLSIISDPTGIITFTLYFKMLAIWVDVYVNYSHGGGYFIV